MSADNRLNVEEVNAEVDRLNDDLEGNVTQASVSSNSDLGFPGFSRSESNSNRQELDRSHTARSLPRSLPSSPSQVHWSKFKTNPKKWHQLLYKSLLSKRVYSSISNIIITL